MRPLNLLCKSIFASLILLSCSSDDSSDADKTDNPNNTQTITIENTSYNVDKGIYSEYGADESHYNVDIYVSNGPIVSYTEDNITYKDFDEDSEIIFSTDLYSNGTENFSFGSFEVIDSFNAIDGENNAIETYLDIIDSDGNEITYDAISGTVTIADNGENNYTVTSNAVYLKSYFDENDDFVTDDSNEITISFSFTGNFTYSNQLD